MGARASEDPDNFIIRDAVPNAVKNAGQAADQPVQGLPLAPQLFNVRSQQTGGFCIRLFVKFSAWILPTSGGRGNAASLRFASK